MISINVYGDIDNREAGMWLSMFGMEDTVCSADLIKKVLADNPDDPELTLNIHSSGGSVSEGLAIYDILRASGKTIYTNIEGSCHSMATVLLLAAPAENRTANKNARALIHKVYAPICDYMNGRQLMELAKSVCDEEDAILNIYADRTGQERSTLEELMDSEKVHNADSLLNLGFISKINSYNTNKKFNKMADKTKKSRWEKFLNNAKNALGAHDLKNYDYLGTEDEVLFSTEGEEDTLAVGDTVTIADGSTSGTFTLKDSRVVTVEDNVVTDIQQGGTEEAEIAELEERIEQLEELVNEGREVALEMKADNDRLETRNADLESQIAKLKGETRSGGSPKNRKSAVQTPGAKNAKATPTSDEKKEEVRSAMAKLNDPLFKNKK